MLKGEFVHDQRYVEMTEWLKTKFSDKTYQIEVASADASFRRYFRVCGDTWRWIVMDAPPDKEDSLTFVTVAQAFKSVGLNVPEIKVKDLTRGFLVITDFGDRAFLPLLADDNVNQLYSDALQSLLILQTKTNQSLINLPMYDAELLLREMQLFSEWFLPKYLNIQLDSNQTKDLESIFQLLIENAIEQPQVWVHRDYHSRNLMYVEENNPGIIDFQDAVIGPITYDLVSLLKDCYIAWPPQQVNEWVSNYLQQLQQYGLCENMTNDKFQQYFDLMGVQRHLKAIGIFSRLNYRDGKSGYLQDIPRTLDYVIQACRNYPALSPLLVLIEEYVLPKLTQKVKQTCAQ